MAALLVCLGNCLPMDQQQPMAHTPGMLRMLERVAAASQSGRVVLLEGETCSGKTQLVVELARLAQVGNRVLSSLWSMPHALFALTA